MDQVSNKSGARSVGDAPPNVEPLTYGTDGFTVIANRIPKQATFLLPHPRTAPKFSMVFDFAEFPVDPRLIRAVGVEIHLGSVSAENYARGMAGERDSSGRPLSILNPTDDKIDPTTGRSGVNKDTLLFYGTADTWEVDHSDKGSQITIEGREIRSLLIGGKPNLAKLAKIDTGQPIHLVVQDIIKSVSTDTDLRITVMTDASEWPGGRIPSPGDSAGLTRVRLKAAGSGTSSTPQTGSKTTYWDLITNYCTLVGAMPYFVGSQLWIRPNARIFDVLDRRLKIGTPFEGDQPREVGDEQLRIRRMVYGRNLKRLRFSRKFAGAVVPTIQTIAFDDQARGGQRLIFGQWPPSESDTAQSKGEEEVLRVPMFGIRSVKQLTEAARGLYEEIGRGETGGIGETSDLASIGGDNSDPDMLRLRPLEPVEFVVDATALHTVQPIVSELNNAARRSFSEEVDLLHAKLGDRALARALVALARGAVRELLAFYQVTSVQFEWNAGVRIQFEFQNYIVPRHSVRTAEAAQGKDLQAARIEVVGANKKAKAKAAAKQAEVTAAVSNLQQAARDVTSQIRRLRNVKTPTVTIGKATVDE